MWPLHCMRIKKTYRSTHTVELTDGMHTETYKVVLLEEGLNPAKFALLASRSCGYPYLPGYICGYSSYITDAEGYTAAWTPTKAKEITP